MPRDLGVNVKVCERPCRGYNKTEKQMGIFISLINRQAAALANMVVEDRGKRKHWDCAGNLWASGRPHHIRQTLQSVALIRTGSTPTWTTRRRRRGSANPQGENFECIWLTRQRTAVMPGSGGAEWVKQLPMSSMFVSVYLLMHIWTYNIFEIQSDTLYPAHRACAYDK